MIQSKNMFSKYSTDESGVLKQDSLFHLLWIQASLALILAAFVALIYPEIDLKWLLAGAAVVPLFFIVAGVKKYASYLAGFQLKTNRIFSPLRTRQTETLKSSDQYFKTFFENNPVGMCLIELRNHIPDYLSPEACSDRITQDGYISECNTAFAELVGYSGPARLMGKKINDVPELQFTDENFSSVFERFAQNKFQLFQSNVTIGNALKNYKITLNGITGDEHLESIWIQLQTMSRPLHHRASDDKFDRYKSIFENSVDGKILIRDEKIVECNPRALEIFETSEDELIGLSVQSILPLVQTDGILSTEKIDGLIKNTLSGRMEISCIQFQRPAGTLIDAEVEIQVVDEADEWVLLLSVRDISNREDNKTSARKKIALEQLITSISTRFINLNPGQILREIQNAIEETAEFLGLNRSYLLLFSEDKSELSCISEYAGNGLDKINGNLQRIPTKGMEEWVKRLSANQVQLLTIPELDNNSSYSGRKFLELTETEMTLELPVKRVENLMGVMGFATEDDAREWSGDEVTMLRTIAEIIGHSLERRKMEQSLRYRSELEKLISEISTRFINISIDKIDTTINDSLGIIMRFTEADAALLYQFSPDMQNFSIRNYAIEQPQRFELTHFQQMKITDYKWWLSPIFQQEVRVITSIDQIPEQAGKERAFSIQTGMNSGVDIPMVYQSKIIGILSFLARHNNRQWSDDEIALFKIVSQVLTNALLRKESEQKLIESERSYRNIFENIRDVYYESSLANIILEISPSIREVSKFSREQLIGKSFSMICSDPAESKIILSEIKREKSISNYEIRIKSSGDSDKYLSINALLIKDEQGHPAKIVGSMRDISENKLLEMQLQQAQKMEAIGTLAGGVAHDFNNLLTAIIGGSDLLLTKLDANDPIAKRVRDIREAGDKASGLTRQLLAFSRKQVLETKILNINDLVNNLKKMLSRLISEDIELVSGFSCENPVIKADPTQIEQVLINLVVNARDAMPQGGKITINTKNIVISKQKAEYKNFVSSGKYVLLSVQDTGHGIRKDLLDKVFDPFFTTKERDKGTGLGLAMVYGIIKQHGGSVWAESEEGKGTTFNIYLPNVSDVKLEPEKIKPEASSVKSGNETVLVAEDDKNVQKLVEYTLSSFGYKVILAENVEDALKISERKDEPIDLLLTDVIMPGLNGRQLFDKISRIRPGIRVIFMSGYNDDVISEKGFLKSDVKFLQKPFTITDLAQRVREVLDS